jgi:hypothetical protein
MISIFLEPLSIKHIGIDMLELPGAGDRARDRRSGSAAARYTLVSRIRQE